MWNDKWAQFSLWFKTSVYIYISWACFARLNSSHIHDLCFYFDAKIHKASIRCRRKTTDERNFTSALTQITLWHFIFCSTARSCSSPCGAIEYHTYRNTWQKSFTFGSSLTTGRKNSTRKWHQSSVTMDHTWKSVRVPAEHCEVRSSKMTAPRKKIQLSCSTSLLPMCT